MDFEISSVYSKEFLLNIERRTEVFGKKYVIGGGNKKLSLCHLDNITSLIESIIFENIEYGIYNVSDNKVYTYNHLQKYQKSNNIINIPMIFVWGVFLIGKVLKNNFLVENSIKLLSDNTYPSDKISQQHSLSKVLI